MRVRVIRHTDGWIRMNYQREQAPKILWQFPKRHLRRRTELKEQLRNLKSGMKYDTFEYTVEELYDGLRDGDIIVPDYSKQREWSDKEKSDYIESLLLDLPDATMILQL